MATCLHKPVFGLSLLVLSLLAVAQDRSSTPLPLQTSICELLTDPDRFDGERVTIQARYFADWEWGIGLQDDRCKGAVRYSSPISRYIPSQYSKLKIKEDVEYHEFEAKARLVCNGLDINSCDYGSIEANFTGTFVSWKRLKGISPMPSNESVLIVTEINNPKLRETSEHKLREAAPGDVPNKIPESAHNPK
jgi:hypothetical protein